MDDFNVDEADKVKDSAHRSHSSLVCISNLSRQLIIFLARSANALLYQFHVYRCIRFSRHVWRLELKSESQRESARRRKQGWLEKATSPTNLSSQSYWYLKRRMSEDARTVKRQGERDRNTKDVLFVYLHAVIRASSISVKLRRSALGSTLR